MFYSCPKYYKENRSDDEKACFNRINLIEYEEMVNEVAKRIAGDNEGMDQINIEGCRWKNKKGTEFTVVKHDDWEIGVKIINHHALRS